MATQRAEPMPAESFTPQLVTVLREGYGPAGLRADAIAGLTVAIVALPLSMAIAIASGVSPDRGLYTAVIGGFVVSALGGSRFQIGGPAGAFIVLVSATVERHGVDGLLLATMLGGLVLLAVGLLRLGTFIKYIPYPVTVGFTAGIAAIIFASQVKDLLGLAPAREPGPLIPKLVALWDALPGFNPAAAALAAGTIGAIVALRRHRPHWPALLVAVAAAALVAWLLGLPVETVGTRFGGIPNAPPAPHLPPLSAERVTAVLPDALAFALLGGIESLLSAVVADNMSGRRHRSNGELVAQGLANLVSPLFGGIPVTGTIARTATNVRAGAHGPVSGMLHALFLLLFMLVAAPLCAYIPLAALAGVLAVVAWNMAEKHQFAALLRASRGDATVVLATFGLVVLRDLTEGILVGFGIGALLFLHRMAQAIGVESAEPPSAGARAGADGLGPHDPAAPSDPDVVVCRISGAFFFGAAAAVETVLDRLAERPRAYVLDLSAVPILDSTAAATVETFVRKARGRGATVYIAGARPPIRRALLVQGVRPPRVRFKATPADAVAAARAKAGAASAPALAGD